MPKNLGQSVVFGVLMVIVMVYFMICYNISLNIGGMTNAVFVMDMGGLTPAVFLLALEELPIMAAIAFVLEFVALGKLAKILAFRFVNPATDKPMVIILAISAMTVCCMCPVMSFIATLMHSGTQALFTNWLQKWFFNFAPALLWQIFFAGPIVRFVFGLIFRERKSKVVAEEA